MTSTERALRRALHLSDKAHKKWSTEIKRLRALLKNCTHSATSKFHYEHDNGYGVQSRHEGLSCDLCLARQYYPGMSELWTSYESWTAPRDDY